MIVRIEMFDAQGTPWTMLFGNNPAVRNWDGEFQLYLYQEIQWYDEKTCTKREIFGIGKVEISDAGWITFGGLKWCDHKEFQHHLNREGCQSWEPDNPAPRQYEKMVFYEDYNEKTRKKAYKMYKERIRHLPDKYTRGGNL